MAVEKNDLRRVMGHFATGVTVVTTRDRLGKHFGLTANSVTSVSLEPPLILVCVDKAADCYACFDESKAFAVNILSEEQQELSRRFATKGAGKFEGVKYREAATGCAILDDGVGYLDCRVVLSYEGGDHTIYLGEVQAAEASETAPLLFFRGGYRKLEG